MNRFVLGVRINNVEEAHDIVAHLVTTYNTRSLTKRPPQIPGHILIEAGPHNFLLLSSPPSFANEAMLRMLLELANGKAPDGVHSEVHFAGPSEARTFLMENAARMRRTEELSPEMQAALDKAKQGRFYA